MAAHAPDLEPALLDGAKVHGLSDPESTGDAKAWLLGVHSPAPLGSLEGYSGELSPRSLGNAQNVPASPDS